MALNAGDQVRILGGKFEGQTGEVFNPGQSGVGVQFPHSLYPREVHNFPYSQVEPLKDQSEAQEPK